MIKTSVSLDFNGVLDLGCPGEKNCRRFEFDLSEWMDHFQSGGSVRLLAQRPYEHMSYPCVLEVGENTAVWTVGEADVQLPGKGHIQLQYVEGDSVVLSAIFETAIEKSLVSMEGEAPEPQQPWVQTVLNAADRAEEAAKRAEDGGDVFVATYGKTTFEELTEAWEAGKVLFCYHGQIMYSLYSANTTGFMFYNITGYYRNTRYCTSSGWKTSTQTEYCARVHAGQHGKNGTDPIKPKDIGAVAGYIRAMYDGEDTDDLTTPGDYSCSNAVAKTIKNAAFNVSHFIHVTSFSPYDDRLVQEAYEQNSNNPHRKWRVLTATGWSPWKDGSAGTPGKAGKDGYTPVRGKDYWTETDIAEIKGYVDEAILGGAW